MVGDLGEGFRKQDFAPDWILSGSKKNFNMTGHCNK